MSLLPALVIFKLISIDQTETVHPQIVLNNAFLLHIIISVRHVKTCTRNVCAYTDAHTDMHACTHTHAHKHGHACMHTDIHAHTNTQTLKAHLTQL